MKISLLLKLMPIGILIWSVRTGALESNELVQTVMNSTKTVACEFEMRSVSRLLRAECMARRGRLDIHNFKKWLHENLESTSKEAHLDHFGSEYQIERVPKRGYVFVSIGPDKQAGTEDDIEMSIPCARF